MLPLYGFITAEEYEAILVHHYPIFSPWWCLYAHCWRNWRAIWRAAERSPTPPVMFRLQLQNGSLSALKERGAPSKKLQPLTKNKYILRGPPLKKRREWGKVNPMRPKRKMVLTQRGVWKTKVYLKVEKKSFSLLWLHLSIKSIRLPNV